MMNCEGMSIEPGARKGRVTVPRSKSHEHRLLIANFLAGIGAEESIPPQLEDDKKSLFRSGRDSASPILDSASPKLDSASPKLDSASPKLDSASPRDNADIAATKRCLAALATDDPAPELDCGESGSTLRFLAPVAAALGKRPRYIRRGRLAERPFKDYASLAPGVHELAGNVSSQFVTGLLFALPLLDGDSEIRFTSPLESRGYVDMTLRVIRNAGIEVEETADGFRVPGNQTYRPQSGAVEGDWSGAAFWYGMNALGSDIRIDGLAVDSAQPDRIIAKLCAKLPTVIDISQFPDNFPVLAVVAAGTPQTTTFVNIARLRLKECDRVAAMEEALERLGVLVQVTDDRFQVTGTAGEFTPHEPPIAIRTFGDHRIAMAAAVAATRASGSVVIDNAECCSKSYPGFFEVFDSLERV